MSDFLYVRLAEWGRDRKYFTFKVIDKTVILLYYSDTFLTY